MSTPHLKINKASSWNNEQVSAFLNETKIPIRLSCIDENGFPLVCSLWFRFEDKALWCATHQSAKIIELLKINPKCGFEIAVNDMPYQGVRGRGQVSLIKEQGKKVLEQLIERYLGNDESKLAQWLLSRAQDEYAIRIDIQELSAWDYSARMSH
jgi:nitroimidazol reductase NimA-like FMN-containing flavoprotein (pyridoxamine 5'-phosphate oxidase superfamily)